MIEILAFIYGIIALLTFIGTYIMEVDEFNYSMRRALFWPIYVTYWLIYNFNLAMKDK